MTRKQTSASTRSEAVRKRRKQQSTRRLDQAVQRAYKPMAKPVQPKRRPSTSRSKSRRQHYDIAFALGTAEVRAPGISIPKPGTRLVSGLLVILLGFALYILWNSPTFSVSGAELVGNQRLGTTEINVALPINQPIFAARPDVIEQTLRLLYSDLASVDVQVALPNRIIVTVAERAPLIAWYQDNSMTWIDLNGVAFQPRGQIEELIPVLANGSPPTVLANPQQLDVAPPFLTADLIQSIIAIIPYMPSGTTLTYDPVYGLGWQDSRGWLVYFGENSRDIPMKLVVYQAIVDHLTRTGVRPALVSVEYLDAPYYR
jgi:hypothetical protein